MQNFTITSHILDALDVYLEGQSDHKWHDLGQRHARA